MRNTSTKIKMNISMSQEIKDYLMEKSDLMGMSASAYISMLIGQSKQQEQALSTVDLFKTMMANMKDMEALKVEDKNEQ